MSPVATNVDVAVLLSQKTPDGATIYLYPVVRDSDVLLSDETGVDNLEELLKKGIKPDFNVLMDIFQNTDDFEFTFDPTTNVIKGTHKNLISAGSAKGSEGEITHGGEVRIPSFSFDKNGHITGASTTVIKLPAGYALPTASATEKGGIKIGTGLVVGADGTTSVEEGTTSKKGIVKLNSATNSDSEADAATPKAVKDALAIASKALSTEISKLTTNGVKPTFSSLSSMFASGSDMEFTFDESGENISVSHKNKVNAGTVSGSEGSVGYGEDISIPTLTIDENGHIKSYGTVKVTIPEAYKLPTASTTEKGGVIIGDGLSIDPLSGVLSANEGSTDKKGIVKLSNTPGSSTTEAATPKAVNDAKEAAQEFATQKMAEFKQSLETEGAPPTYEGTSTLFGDSDNIVVVKNASGKVISFKHKNEVAEGSLGTGGATLFNGGTILVPTFKYDTNGHITQSGTEQIIIKPFVGRKGITVENEYIGHENEITSGSTVKNTEGTLAFGGSFNVPEVTYDNHGHITSVAYKELSLPGNPNTDTTYGLSVTGGADSESVGDAYDTISKNYTVKFTGSDGTNKSFNIGSSYFRYHAFSGLNDGLVPAAGSANTDKFLKGDGTWATPTNTQYTGSNGIKLDGTTFKHTNAITAGSVNPGAASTLAFGGVVKIPTFAYDANGHITSASLVSFTLPSNPIVNYSISKSGNTITLTGTDGSSSDVTITPYTHPTSGVKAGTYRSVTVNANGHVTSGTNPTTLAGYGITDAAPLTHTHVNADIESLDGSKITGTLPISVIPKAALERLVPVTNDTARFALTESDVQLGDTVKVASTGLMYFVKDVSKLSSEDGYEPYSAGAAASVAWTGITGKPSTFTPSSHEHKYAGSSSAGGAATTAIGDDKGNKISATYVASLSVSGKVITITYGDGTTKTISTQDTNTTYSAMTGATSSAAGKAGLVPAPASGKQNAFLRGDGTWATPTNTTYNVVTDSANGLMSSAMLAKLNGIAEGANNYTHPAYTAQSSGFYKVTIDASGHVSATTAVTKADITALGIPGSDTKYSVVTDSANGLMSSAMLAKLNGIAEGANNYTHPAYTAKSSGLYKITVDATGHVSAVTAVTKSDITGLGIPGSDTKYSVATTSANGLMSSDMVSKLNGIATGANKYTHPSYTEQASGFYKVTVDATGHVSAVTAVTKSDITGLGIPGSDTKYSAMTGASSSAAGKTGLVPAPASGKQNAFLRGDGTWATPYTHPSYTEQASGLYKITVDSTGHVSAVTAVTKSDITGLGIPSTNTTYSTMKAASSSAAGSSGLVPAPGAGKQNSFLRGDGTWVVPTNTTYSVVTDSANGLMSSAMLSKLNGIATGANKYTHPAYTAQASGLYKITVDATGHVSAVTAVAKSDITALGIPGSDTKYSVATTSANGLMSSTMVKRLNTELDPIVISGTAPSNPASGYLMWYKVLSTE